MMKSKGCFVAEWSIGNRYAVCFVTATVLANHTNVCMYQIYTSLTGAQLEISIYGCQYQISGLPRTGSEGSIL